MAESKDQMGPDRSLMDAVVAPVARVDRIRAAVRRAHAPRRVVRDLAAVLAVVGTAVTMLACVGDTDADPTSAAALLMAGLAIWGGSAATLMMVFAARLTGSPQMSWLGLVVGWYGLLAIPISTVRGLDAEPESLSAAGLVLVHAVAILLWLLVLVPPSPRTITHVLWGLLGATPPLVAGAVLWAAASPASAEAAAASRPWWLACALVWILGGLVVVGRASRNRVPGVPGVAVVGAGFALLGAAQVAWWVLPSPGLETTPLSAALRLVAVAVVLCGGLRILGRALLRLEVAQAFRARELWRADVRLARAAERDHDLRNGLAGLAGATAVMGGGADGGALSRVVAGELRRLDGMLAQPSGQDRGDPRGAYAVAPALDGLVMLRRSVGMDVRADVERNLCAVGSPGTLAQVVTNLLSNAERHAPGSPVRITGRRRDDRVEIRVRDFGFGVPAGRERAVLELGTRDQQTGGLGLGLHVCRTLLAAQNATIEILPLDVRSPGCMVVLGLPAGDAIAPVRPGRPLHEGDAAPAAS